MGSGLKRTTFERMRESARAIATKLAAPLVTGLILGITPTIITPAFADEIKSESSSIFSVPKGIKLTIIPVVKSDEKYEVYTTQTPAGKNAKIKIKVPEGKTATVNLLFFPFLSGEQKNGLIKYSFTADGNKTEDEGAANPRYSPELMSPEITALLGDKAIGDSLILTVQLTAGEHDIRIQTPGLVSLSGYILKAVEGQQQEAPAPVDKPKAPAEDPRMRFPEDPLSRSPLAERTESETTPAPKVEEKPEPGTPQGKSVLDFRANRFTYYGLNDTSGDNNTVEVIFDTRLLKRQYIALSLLTGAEYRSDGMSLLYSSADARLHSGEGIVGLTLESPRHTAKVAALLGVEDISGNIQGQRTTHKTQFGGGGLLEYELHSRSTVDGERGVRLVKVFAELSTNPFMPGRFYANLSPFRWSVGPRPSLEIEELWYQTLRDPQVKNAVIYTDQSALITRATFDLPFRVYGPLAVALDLGFQLNNTDFAVLVGGRVHLGNIAGLDANLKLVAGIPTDHPTGDNIVGIFSFDLRSVLKK